jgi:transcription elongation factor GreA
MLASDNSKFLEQVAKHLECAPDILKDVYYTIFSFSKKYPAQYQWMLKRIQAGRLPEYLNPGFLPRLIDSLDYVKGIKGLVWKILNLESFDKIIAKANSDEAKRILEAVHSSRVLENYKQKDYARIIEYHHPNLFKRKIDIIYTTEQALKNKQDELQQLVSIQIPENKKEIRRAREFGDLSENFEYKAARQKQAQLYGKVRIIESELNKAQIITPDGVDTTKVSIGTKVMIKNLIDEEQIHYTILGRWDTDLDKNIISNEAPVAQALLKHARGEKITINKVQYEIIKIEKAI